MTVDDLRFRLESIQREVTYALEALGRLEGAARETVPEEARCELPDELTAGQVMEFYTRKSYSDLNAGVVARKYPAPITEAGNKRLWKREAWDAWKAKR